MNEILYTAGFYFLAVITVAAAMLVVYNRNPLVSALFLALSFIGASGLFVYLEAHFLAFIQVIIYAGAVVVLFIYVIMLLDLNPDKVKYTHGLFVKITGALIFVAVTFVLLVNVVDLTGVGFSALRPEYSTVFGLANELFSVYVVPFELVSIVLMVGIIGGVMLVKKIEKKREES